MLEVNAIMNETMSELKVLRKQVNQLKHIIETKNITIKKLREELTDVKQDRSNILLSWAEIADHYTEKVYQHIKDEDKHDSTDI